MCDEADKCRENEAKEEIVNRRSKRSLKLLRGNERDLKLDVEAALNYAERSERSMMCYTPKNMKVIYFFPFLLYVHFVFTIFLWLLIKSIY